MADSPAIDHHDRGPQPLKAMGAAFTVDRSLVNEFFNQIGGEAAATGLDTAIQLSRVGRYLERVADHGVNIGQHVHYSVTGAFPGDRKAAD